MTLHELGPLVYKLCSYYERKPPGADTLSEWIVDLSTVPADSVFMAWVPRTIKTRFPDAFPKGFPGVLRRLWLEWLKDNPKRVARIGGDIPCMHEECEDGVIFARRLNPDTKHMDVCVFACADCGRAGAGWEKARVSDLWQRGFIHDSLADRAAFLVKPQPKRRSHRAQDAPIGDVVSQVREEIDVSW